MALEVSASTPIMQTLRPSQVPDYLRTSSFFLGLNVVGDDDEFSIPANHMKLNTNVGCLNDMTELLNTIRFWGLDIVPQEVVDFAAGQPVSDIHAIFEPFRADMPFIASVCSIVSGHADSRVRLEKAMNTGNIDVVRYFHRKGEPFSARAIALAAGKGALDCLQYATSGVHISYYFHNEIFAEAVRNGCMDSILFLRQKGFALQYHAWAHNVDLVTIAALAGQYDVLKYLHSQGCSIKSAAIAAADAGNFDCLEYAIKYGALLRNEYPFVTGSRGPLAQRLAQAGQLKLFPLALARENEIDAQTALFCVKCENLEFWRLCVDCCARLSIDLIAAVTQNGNLACLEYLHQLFAAKADVSGQGLNWIDYATSVSDNGYLRPVDIAQMTAAAEKWENLGFLITHDCPMNKHLATSLVQAGQLELYHLATAHGCQVSVQAARQFAKEGSLNLLQHALDHGCERSEEILRAAARHGQLQCLIYARAQGCPWSAQVTLAAARGGHLECLQYLHQHGCPSYAHVRSACPK